MSIFVVQLKNQPGELAAVLDVLAAAGVNVMLAAATAEDRGTLLFVGDDNAATRGALTDAGVTYDEKSSLVIRVDNKPGVGATFCRTLADAGINVDFLLPLEVDREHAALVAAVDDEATARRVLGDVVVAP